MKLSLVVAAYNIEDYIGDCLRSIFQQNAPIDCYEVIVVNDGSKDNTLNIIKSFEEGQPNLIIIDQINKGLSAARNAGLKKANGECILFVDGDDAITNNSIEKIISSFIKYPKTDFLIFDWIHNEIDINKKTYSRPLRDKDRKYYEQPLERNKADKILTRGVQWLIVYRTEYLRKNNLEYLEGILYEDNEFRMRAFFFANEIRFIPFAHYIYSANRVGSITTDITSRQYYKDKDIDSFIKATNNWLSFEKQYANTPANVKFINFYISDITGHLLRIASVFSDYQKNKYEQFVHIWKQEYIQALKKSFSIKFFHPIFVIRTMSTLFFPKYYNCISKKYLKMIIKKYCGKDI